MRLTIFRRLISGYLLILILLSSFIGYTIFQHHQFDTMTQAILKIDQRIVEYQKKLTESLLSQMRYERKYMILHDRILYQQFLSARNDFFQSLDGAMLLADTVSQKAILQKVRASHEDYQSLIQEETGNLQGQSPYSQQWYQQEKEKLIDRMLWDLETLALDSQQNTREKTQALDQGKVRARQIAGILAILTLLAVLGISLWITRSITRPISRLIEKTREISRGVFKESPPLSAPPEVQELTRAFDSMGDQLRQADQMKSDFFSTISHEMRTPLTSIKEGTSLLLEGKGGELTEKQGKILKIIADESQRLIHLVNSSLDLAKMEAGMTVFHFAEADMLPLIHQVVGEVQPLAMSRRIGLRFENPDSLPRVQMDPERILQVLRNLIGNALKFTPEGGRVSVIARHNDAHLMVRVQDTGAGIPKELLATIFEKFQQGPQNPLHRPSSLKGTGLGLAIAKHIITSHGGKVWAESEPGQGSSFIFVLPA